jgi:anti-sigma B factor antagonist
VQSYLKVFVRRRGRSTVVEIDGELDLASSPQLKQALEQAWRNGSDEVVLDLGKLRFMDVAGLRVLLRATQCAEERGTDLVMTNIRRPIRRVLTLTGMNGLLPIREGG